MKRIRIASLWILILLLIGGCGGNQEPLTSISVAEDNNFTGTYQIRDDNCDGDVINSFKINMSETSLTIIDSGGVEGVVDGDVFGTSEKVLRDNTPIIEIDFLQCIGWLIRSEEQAFESQSNYNINTETGDLLIRCSRVFSNGTCYLAYARTARR